MGKVEPDDVGLTVPEYTHYAHVRYTAADHPGIIWYDPRDGRERFVRDVNTDTLEIGERVVTSAVIKPWRPEAHGEPTAKHILEINYAVNDPDDPPHYTATYRDSDVFESREAAECAAAISVPGYDDAPCRDALAFRTGIVPEEVRADV